MMYNKTLFKYMEEIGKVPLITSEKEIQLAKRVKRGNKKARDHLILANLRFVINIAKHYKGSGIPLEDLICEGNMGLIKAATRFDAQKGFKFITYAVWWIRQAIQQAISDQARLIRLPASKAITLRKVKKSIKNLQQSNQHQPSDLQIAEENQISEKEVQEISHTNLSHLSLDSDFSETDKRKLLDIIEDKGSPHSDDKLINEDLQEEIERNLATLKKREAHIVKLYYGIGYEKAHTLNEIGKMIGLTRERIRQIKIDAIRRLRHRSRSKKLRPYLV